MYPSSVAGGRTVAALVVLVVICGEEVVWTLPEVE